MEQNILVLKSVNEIMGEDFIIPDYQRGYRWGEEQVVQLLEDIWEFSEKEKRKEDIYCLQPVIVKQEKNKWEVIDGQQRLTTIYLILTYLNSPKFNIAYQTRPTSGDFLKKIATKEDHSNVDFHYMSVAYQKITDWFTYWETEKKEFQIKQQFIITLGKSTKVIWYEIKDGTDAREIFTRINIGKIPLTNAELIKALFLSSDNFNDADEQIYLKQLEIANEWDQMEYSLQDSSFWYFVNKESNPLQTRIEFIFNLVVNKPPANQDNLFTFHEFNGKLNVKKEEKEKKIHEVWDEIKQSYGLLREWYEDWELYHLIGYLVTVGEKLQVLLTSANGVTKSAFKKSLRTRIKKYVGNDWADLHYGEKEDKRIQHVLLLFNILSILRAGDRGTRFSFNRYKGDGDINRQWSLEHIHAQHSEGLNTQKQWEAWLNEHKLSLERIDPTNFAALISKIERLNTKEINREQFNGLHKDIMAVYKKVDEMSDDEMHHISNLALLDSRSNSALNNSVFEVKRQLIIQREKKAEFIPLCTRNVFLKYYTGKADNLYFWGKTDRKNYFHEIEELIKPYQS